MIPIDTIHHILVSLGFSFTFYDTGMTLQVPSWRASKDISIKEDIAEEVIRIYGYDHIPLSPLTSEFSISSKNTEKSLRNLTLAFWE